VKKCPYCAEDIQDAATVCKHCGRDLVGATAGTVTTSAQPKKRVFWKVVVGSIGILILLAVIGSLLEPTSRGPGQGAARLDKMGDEQRGHILRSTIESTGQKCQEVTRQYRQGETKGGDVLWNTTCFGGRSFAIMINEWGGTRVLDCIDLKAFAGVTCFDPLQ
jgi:hypothetical protein